SHPQTRAEDRVDVGQGEARVGERVPRCLRVQHEGGLVRQLAVLVRLAGARDGDAAAHVAQLAARLPAPPAAPALGGKGGSAASRVTSTNVTSTGMPIRILPGSASMPTRFVIMRGPSASSTIASTYGWGSGKPFCPRCTTVNVWRVPRPLTGFQSM